MESQKQEPPSVDDNKLRQIERQYKLRVKTGCDTCRARRVKCDETKPECMRCTKTGRKCEGYKHEQTARKSSPTAAASFRNPSFLVVPPGSYKQTIPRNPSRSISPDNTENRSFHYFQQCTLPNWTEFFDSDLWSQKILQLSHSEPAIKHGVLALSTLHERFENTEDLSTAESNDFAFVQYMQAVKHSNDLLTSHQEGKKDVDSVLIACIIFTSYESLAGNYRAANMHLRNGLRIYDQYRRTSMLTVGQPTASQEAITSILYRFDLSSMFLSDNSSPYQYNLESPLECPQISPTYTRNDAARDDLVDLLRTMMWVSSIASINPHAIEDPTWSRIYTELMAAFTAWEKSFSAYLKDIPPHEAGNPKIYAGNTLLKIYSILARTIVAAGAGLRAETAYDPLISYFKTIVDLVETLPHLTASRSRASSESQSPSPSAATPTPTPPSTTPTPTAGPSTHRPIAPNPIPSTPSPPAGPGPSQHVFHSSPIVALPIRSSPPQASPRQKLTSFTPSYELSSIVPLFVVACRCRDPILRRRALQILLTCRRREGAWDSVGAGMVALQAIRLEEGLEEVVEPGPDNWLPLSATCRACGDVSEERRVQNVFVQISMRQRCIAVDYVLRSGEGVSRYVRF